MRVKIPLHNGVQEKYLPKQIPTLQEIPGKKG
jgi:hypothetical protein